MPASSSFFDVSPPPRIFRRRPSPVPWFCLLPRPGHRRTIPACGEGLCCNKPIKPNPEASNGPARRFLPWMIPAMKRPAIIAEFADAGSARRTPKTKPGTTAQWRPATKAARAENSRAFRNALCTRVERLATCRGFCSGRLVANSASRSAPGFACVVADL